MPDYCNFLLIMYLEQTQLHSILISGAGDESFKGYLITECFYDTANCAQTCFGAF